MAQSESEEDVNIWRHEFSVDAAEQVADEKITSVLLILGRRQFRNNLNRTTAAAKDVIAVLAVSDLQLGLYGGCSSTGAHVIALTLHDLGVNVIFGLVGIPVVDIAEEAINLGIRFIGFRNEQACSYAASAYGFLTGKPGVCLLVGGPGVLHGLAGIGNCSANAFPSLFLAGSSETNLVGKGAFQELDAISFLTPHTKLAVRPSSKEPDAVADAIRGAYHSCWAGRPGPTFVDLPADLIMDEVSQLPKQLLAAQMQPPTKPHPDPTIVSEAVKLLRGCSSPLVIVGKGAAYARAEVAINAFVSSRSVPFLPTPMGKGVIPDNSRLNASSARSTALKEADVILLLGARLNWILHFGQPPKFRPDVKIVQVDISAEELGRTNGIREPSIGIVSNIGAFVEELHRRLNGWQAFPSNPSQDMSSFLGKLSAAALKNEKAAEVKALTATVSGSAFTYQRAFYIIKETLHRLSPPEQGNIVYVSEGANTMDISRSIFPLHHPRQRLDAGTYATMGVGMGYSIAAYAAYNLPHGQLLQGNRKKIVALEGDSALGFSAMEIETMQRQKMPILIFVMNNSGVYHGDTANAKDWELLQKQTAMNEAGLDESGKKKGLRSTSLWYETRYEMLAEMVGGRGFFVRSEEELEHATRESYHEQEKVCVVNVVVEPGLGKSIGFAWQQKAKKGSGDPPEAKHSKL